MLVSYSAENIILVPNQRTAEALKRHEQGLQQGLESTIPSHIFVIDNWLSQQWQTCLESADPICFDNGSFDSGHAYQLLNDVQVVAIWRQVLLEVLGTESPLTINQDILQLAHQAQRGWRLLQRAQLTSANLKVYEVGSSYPFYQWIDAFQAKMQAQYFCTFEDILLKLSDYFQRQKHSNQILYKQIICQGFEQSLPPLYQSLLQQACQTLSHKDMPNQLANGRQAIACDDQDEEIMAALHWSQQLLMEQPESKIGIIIGNLSQRRQAIKRQISYAASNPALMSQLTVEQIAMGGSSQLLQQAPVISAWQLLQMNRGWLTLTQCQQYLQSPFWLLSNPDYDGLRVEIENNLYQAQVRELSVANWRKMINQSEKLIHSVDFIVSERLHTFYEKRKELNDKNSLMTWFSLFQSQLALLGWNELSLTPQHLQQWRELPKACQHLNKIVGICSCNEALSWWYELCQQRYPLSLDNRPIQIIDTISGALDYDHIWFCGADNQQWPGPPSSHQLIPVALQKSANMPGSSAEIVRHTCIQLLRYLQKNCANLVFSYCLSDQSHPQQQSKVTLSPLLLNSLLFNREVSDEAQGGKQLSDIQLVDKYQLLPNFEYQPTEPVTFAGLEYVNIDSAPPVSEIEKQQFSAGSISGGSGLVAATINCPFTAFVQYRLNAWPQLEPIDGIDPLMRGNLVHWALEGFWQAVTNSATLLALDNVQLEQLCRRCAQSAIEKLRLPTYRVIAPALLTVEQQRLQTLLQKWILIEQQRPTFDVQALEKPMQIDIGGLHFRLRIDRMDMNEQGQLLLIDYKTSNYLTSNQWGNPEESMAPVAPQLPLYVVAMNDAKVSGISFAQINTKQQRLLGICAAQSWQQKGIKAVNNWQQWCHYWQEVISDAVSDYIQGKTTITEKINQLDAYSAVHRWPAQQQKANQLNERKNSSEGFDDCEY